jgi:hypothetical protein
MSYRKSLIIFLVIQARYPSYFSLSLEKHSRALVDVVLEWLGPKVALKNDILIEAHCWIEIIASHWHDWHLFACKVQIGVY